MQLSRYGGRDVADVNTNTFDYEEIVENLLIQRGQEIPKRTLAFVGRC